jgi:DNA-binding LytR/AlgR family response regulator
MEVCRAIIILSKKDLIIAIELALSNFSSHSDSKSARGSDNYLINDSFFVKDGQCFHKIKFDQVLYIESNHAYITLFTQEKKYVVRGSISMYLEKMDSNKFFRAHRSYAVNLDKVDRIDAYYFIINDDQIPVSKIFRD